MHTISIPFRIAKGEDVIYNKRLGYSVMVRTAYSLLAKQKKPLPENEKRLSEAQIKEVVKHYFQLKYNMESLSLENALVDAKAILKADEDFQKSHQEKQIKIKKENKILKAQRDKIKQDLKELHVKKAELNPDSKEYETVVQNITKQNKKLKSLKDKKVPQNYTLGHIVFGGKANLLAHKKRVDKLNKQILFTQIDTSLSHDETDSKVNELNGLIEQSKKQWKESRLRPLSIGGEIRKAGNRFFKLSDDLKTCYLTFTRKESGTRAGPSITETAELSLAPLNGKWHWLLTKLVEMAGNNEITLFFRLNDNKLDITYDETVLTRSFQSKRITSNIKKSDSTKIKKVKTQNPLKRNTKQFAWYQHPESSVMTSINENRAIGIDLNPEWISASVIELKHDSNLDIKDVRQVTVLDYKLFKIDAKVNNKDSDYSKKAMAECLSNIADAVIRLVRFYNIGKIYMEDRLGKLKGGTKSKHLNGLLNYWGRTVFTKILERKAGLTECEALSVKYHVIDEETGELLYKKVEDKKKGDNTDSVKTPVCKVVTEYKQGINRLSKPLPGLELSREQGLKSCVKIDYVWAGYSSIIGNMVNWQVLSKESKQDSLDNTCSTVSGLIPDACGSGIEIARRGLVKSFTGKVELPLFDVGNLIVAKKDVLEQRFKTLEQSDFDSLGWGKLAVVLRQIPKKNWLEIGFYGYRNQHHSYLVKGKKVVTVKVTGVCLKNRLADVGNNDSHVGRDVASSQHSSTRYYE